MPGPSAAVELARAQDILTGRTVFVSWREEGEGTRGVLEGRGTRRRWSLTGSLASRRFSSSGVGRRQVLHHFVDTRRVCVQYADVLHDCPLARFVSGFGTIGDRDGRVVSGRSALRDTCGFEVGHNVLLELNQLGGLWQKPTPGSITQLSPTYTISFLNPCISSPWPAF